MAYPSMAKVMRIKNIEPQKRNKDGMRWMSHRFPIKGGISLLDAWRIDMARPNPMWEHLFNKRNAA